MQSSPPTSSTPPAFGIPKPVVLVGLMGAGKTTIGRRLAKQLNLPFVDSDNEIEARAGITINEIFERYGEPAFRDQERKVVMDLLRQGPMILATGGGAFIIPELRERIKAEAISVWLKADVETLLERVSRKQTRPLLKEDDPRAVLDRLAEQRYPQYAEADIVIDSAGGDHLIIVQRIVEALGTSAGGAR